MIYDKDGNRLTACYDKNGMAINSAYDKDGSIVYRKQTDQIQLSDIASYYQSPVLAEVEALNNLSDDYRAFIICTDIHSNNNSQNSQNIIRYLLKNSKADKCFLLGDYSVNGWSETEYTTYATPLAENCASQVYATLGNHEWFTNTLMSNLSAIYDDFLADKTNLVGNPSRYYYYFDDTSKQIRYIAINTADVTDGSGANYGFQSAQQTWLRNAVQLPSSSWKAVVLGHHSLVGDDGVMSTYATGNSTIIADILKTCNGTIIGYFCGHEHCDWVYTAGNGSIKCVTLACDVRAASGYYEDKGVPYPANRTRGTINEQAITVVKINTVTRNVSFDRIGAVFMDTSDMSYTY